MYRNLVMQSDEGRLRMILPDLGDWPSGTDRFSYTGWRRGDTADWARRADLESYLPMILLKVDRGSMYSSLEVRTPLLDREVIDVASRIDWQSCLDPKTGIGKMPLRNCLARYVRQQSVPKLGFQVADDAWLRGPLRPVFQESVLERKSLMGMRIDQRAMTEMYREHCAGERNHRVILWRVLSLALWENRYMKRSGRYAC